MQPAIGDYALIGDCGSAALVSRGGSIDWLCWPRFDSPSLFAALLDPERGGCFRIAPAHASRSVRAYRDETNVLVTTHHTDTGVLRVTDLFAVAPGEAHEGALWPEHQLLREVCCTDGVVDVEVLCDPRFDYGRRRRPPHARGELGWFYADRGDVCVLRSEMSLLRDGETALRGGETLRKGERRFVSLSFDMQEPATVPPLGGYAAHKLKRSIEYWRGWSGRCDYQGPYRGAVVRSALVLKLLTYAASGAIVAAPTTSLPERLAGGRNWDYRFCWLRDASFVLRVLFELGYVEEGEAFFSWLLYTARRTAPMLRVLYDVHGGTRMEEHRLEHLTGYRGAKPVLVGNGASQQFQLDVYGSLVGAAYEFCQRGGRLDRMQARLFARLGEEVCNRWREPDAGIWEVRGPQRDHVHSKVMAWVAVDRLLELRAAGHLALPVSRFEKVRDEIREQVERCGFDEESNSYVSYYGGRDVDASLLLLALYGYRRADHPRMRGTHERICKELARDALLWRYPADWDPSVPEGEGAFGICGFWNTEFLARAGRIDEAYASFDAQLRHANDVGLFGEEIDADTGDVLGNFPQGLTHLGLVSAALAIAEAEAGRAGAGRVSDAKVSQQRGRGRAVGESTGERRP